MVIRGIYLKGAAVSVYGPRAVALVLLSLATVAVAAAVFKKDLE